MVAPLGGFSEPCSAPSGKVTELLAVLVGEIYQFIHAAGWTGAMRVKFLAQGNTDEQQQQLMELCDCQGNAQTIELCCTTYNIMQVKCDECELWYHHRCINLRMSKHHDTI